MSKNKLYWCYFFNHSVHVFFQQLMDFKFLSSGYTHSGLISYKQAKLPFFSKESQKRNTDLRITCFINAFTSFAIAKTNNLKSIAKIKMKKERRTMADYHNLN